MPKRALRQRIIDAEVRGSQWLAEGNSAREAGNHVRASECYAKSQYWLDRYNLLVSNSDRPAPKK
ncbi:MAG: hypothetical protein KZQ97_13910 [Candidatus Thiodiazotropha sp. (ex Dulcina madagascariensis)]|nr:hypothetical protein [Candidatus Thiodiazotropha sp. (ex Dulcina madagascariensis)]